MNLGFFEFGGFVIETKPFSERCLKKYTKIMKYNILQYYRIYHEPIFLKIIKTRILQKKTFLKDDIF